MMRTPAARPPVVVPAEPSSSPGKWIIFAISWGAGYYAMRLMPGMLAARVIGGIIAGMLVGLVPFAVARSRGDSRFGQHAIAWCACAGAVLGVILAAPVALGFTIAAARRTPSS